MLQCILHHSLGELLSLAREYLFIVMLLQWMLSGHKNKHAIIRAWHDILTVVQLKLHVFWDVTQCDNLKDLNLHTVVHVNVMYIAEVTAVCIYEYLFQLLTVLQLLAIEQNPEKNSHELLGETLCVVNLYCALCERHKWWSNSFVGWLAFSSSSISSHRP